MEQYYDDVMIFSMYELIKIETEFSPDKVKDNGEPLKIYSFVFMQDDKVRILKYEENDKKLLELLNSLSRKLELKKEQITKRNNELIERVSINVSKKRLLIRALIAGVVGVLTFVGLTTPLNASNIVPNDVLGMFVCSLTLATGSLAYYIAGLIQPNPSRKDSKKIDKMAKKFDKCNNLCLQVNDILKKSYGNVRRNTPTALLSRQKIKYYDDEYNFEYKR